MGTRDDDKYEGEGICILIIKSDCVQLRSCKITSQITFINNGVKLNLDVRTFLSSSTLTDNSVRIPDIFLTTQNPSSNQRRISHRRSSDRFRSQKKVCDIIRIDNKQTNISLFWRWLQQTEPLCRAPTMIQVKFNYMLREIHPQVHPQQNHPGIFESIATPKITHFNDTMWRVNVLFGPKTTHKNQQSEWANCQWRQWWII